MHQVRGPLDNHRPAGPVALIDLVDLEADPVVGVGDPGVEVLVQRPVGSGAEHHGLIMHPIVHRQDERAISTRISDSADLTGVHQPEAFRLGEFLHDSSHTQVLPTSGNKLKPAGVFRRFMETDPGIVTSSRC